MNRIYWDNDSIGIVTDLIDASSHSHPAMQLFLSIEEKLDIEISDELFSCRCVVVDKNIRHAFNAKGRLHFSLIVEPTTMLAEQLCKKMNSSGYLIYDIEETEDVQQQAKHLLQNHSIEGYHELKNNFLSF